MDNLYEKLSQDIRMQEGLHACMNCGVCTAICPAAEIYNYDPRIICDTIQSKDNEEIEALLKSETIWYCGECMSCKTRCPRGNTVGLIIMALRALSQELGYFAESEKGRQQLFLKRVIGGWIVSKGYCLYLEGIGTDLYPGILRKIPDEAMAELNSIFKTTGAFDRFEKIERFSQKKAEQMNLTLDDTLANEYIGHIYSKTEKNHNAL